MRLFGIWTRRIGVARLWQASIEPIAIAVEIRLRCFLALGLGAKLVVCVLIHFFAPFGSCKTNSPPIRLAIFNPRTPQKCRSFQGFPPAPEDGQLRMVGEFLERSQRCCGCLQSPQRRASPLPGITRYFAQLVWSPESTSVEVPLSKLKIEAHIELQCDFTMPSGIRLLSDNRRENGEASSPAAGDEFEQPQQCPL